MNKHEVSAEFCWAHRLFSGNIPNTGYVQGSFWIWTNLNMICLGDLRIDLKIPERFLWGRSFTCNQRCQWLFVPLKQSAFSVLSLHRRASLIYIDANQTEGILFPNIFPYCISAHGSTYLCNHIILVFIFVNASQVSSSMLCERVTG